MDKDEGLPSLPDKSIDLCMADIPFNVHLGKPDNKSRISKNIRKDAILYDDQMDDYEGFCRKLLIELERICNGILIYCGSKNLVMWCRIKDPRQIIGRISLNSRSCGSITYFTSFFPIVCYGDFNNRLRRDIFIYHSNNGFLGKKEFIHPCPLNKNFWFDLIKQIKPESVIDPFLGSGTTAEVCSKLGIKWLGYEINEVYSQDINKRLLNCVKEPQIIELDRWISAKIESF